MSAGEVSLDPHPEAIRVLKVEAAVWLVTAFLAVAMVLMVALLSVRPLTWGDGAWMAAAVLIAGMCVWSAKWALTWRPPRLGLGDDWFSVGDSRVPLDGTTTIESAEKGRLPGPGRSNKVLLRMPGMSMFPHFDGGPRILVRTGDAHVTFQPLLYGPALFFGAVADPRAAELVERLIGRARRSDAAAWLGETFAPPGGPPKVETRITVFLTSYIIVTVAILAFLGWLLVKAVGRGPH